MGLSTRRGCTSRERCAWACASTDWPAEVLALLRKGVVIPAHPLALDADRKLDPRRQRALTRYYLDAGAGGLAVGVHTTQFAIREVGLYRPVLELAMRTAREWATPPVVMIAGAGRPHRAGGPRGAARARARLSRRAAFARRHEGRERGRTDRACRGDRARNSAGRLLPQPAVGGIVLPVSFWRRFAAIENVVAIKMAPFNRYRTLDVVRGVVEAGAADRITLYTGNDDHIVLDLVTPYAIPHRRHGRHRADQGRAARALERLGRKARRAAGPGASGRGGRRGAGRSAGARFAGDRLQRGDLRRRQRFPRRDRRLPRNPAPAGLARGHLVPRSRRRRSGPGQKEEIDRVCAAYPHLNDDAFVRAKLERWLA